jgi:hypothetical protein
LIQWRLIRCGTVVSNRRHDFAIEQLLHVFVFRIKRQPLGQIARQILLERRLVERVKRLDLCVVLVLGRLVDVFGCFPYLFLRSVP